ncbi:MAG TPA: phosphotransferase [Micromonosporaceae bacterium]
MPQPCDQIWANAEWRAEVTEWVRAVTAHHGLRITGEFHQPRIRFWSTQLTVPTDAGVLWFKENCPGQAFEARLVALLAELTPDQVVAPLAVEPERGWLLTPDGGETLTDSADLDTWLRVVMEWAQVQRCLADHVGRLQDAGVSLMPTVLAAELTERYTDLSPDRPGHLDPETAERVRARLPVIAEWGRHLAATGLPVTLDHNDLHADNAFTPRPGERLRFFDFADAVLGHPLCSLMVPLRTLGSTLGCGDDDPGLRRLVDAYLEVWTDLADRATLRSAVAPALRLAALHRAESWRRVLPYASASERSRYGDPAAHWLATVLD